MQSILTEKRTKKEVLITGGAVLGFALILAVVKGVQIYIAISNQFTPPPTTVTSIEAQQTSWPKTLKAVGTLGATQGTMLSAELAGRIKSVHFNSGDDVKKDSLLIALDTSFEEAALKGAEALHEQASQALERARSLRAKNANSISDLEVAEMRASEGQASVDTLRATIRKKNITAPFDGKAGIRLANEGEYVKEGQELVPLFSLDPLYLNFSLPQSSVGKLKAGLSVSFLTDAYSGDEFRGEVTAIDPEVDELTREIDVQATIKNPEGKLRPGMFGEVTLSLAESESVIAIPSSGISYAPYGDTVFVIEKVKPETEGAPEYLGVRQQVVKLGSRKGEQIAVLSGIKAGEKIVTSGTFQLRPGAPIVENNAVTPGNDPAPNPADT